LFLSIVGAMAVAWTADSDRGGLAVSPGSRPDSRAIGERETAGRNSGPRFAAVPLSIPSTTCGPEEPSARDRANPSTHITLKPVATNQALEVPETPIGRALRAIEACQARYDRISDYVCTFSKRERIDGSLTPLHVMSMKVRTRPQSIYLRFSQPGPGREAIYIAGRNGGKVLAHDVGLKRLLAGTLTLEPTCDLAMEDCRHPITQAGIGPLLHTIEGRWAAELDPSESLVAFRDGQLVGSRACTLIETTHPRHEPHFLFYRVRVYIDRDLGLPIRFEAYDWPTTPQDAPELVEEYTYTNIKLNVGLRDVDFDVSNTDYAFGRF